MMFTKTVSEWGNQCKQVYSTDFEWATAFTMALASKAHETLLFLFARHGVLAACICDNAKEIIQGKFLQKLKDAACHSNSWSHILPSQKLKNEILELKKGISHELL